MSNATRFVVRLEGLSLAVSIALILCIFFPVQGYAADPAVAAEAPTPSTQPLADPSPDSPDGYVGEGVPDQKPLSSAQVLQMLQNGNDGRPLSIADLAAINDTMKRVEFAAQLQQKMNQASQGVVSSTGQSASSPPPPGLGLPSIPVVAVGGSPTVVRVFAMHGQFKAVVSTGADLMVVKAGDMIGSSRVTGVSLEGVRVVSGGQSSVLPFARPAFGFRGDMQTNP